MNEYQIAYFRFLGINIDDVEETKAGLLRLKNKKGRSGKPKRFIERLKNQSFILLIGLYDKLLSIGLRPIHIDVPLLFQIVKRELEFSDKQTYEYVWAMLAIDAILPPPISLMSGLLDSLSEKH